ncbi:CRISPR-associated endonuclease Cas2 [Aeromonas hydrophila]|uniref:CRISPR-associated endonuclease Cas2 n=1 Tax=Aeromonas hydrophila TaxID=644 RepID=UPI001B3A273B|nr:CRISPR-associated endonuclease Cas2 [Aeromonas hydrophila]MBQ4676644.1 hypothetical protein [Aeromonas hydrophila]MBW3813249.1 hypothetical protein [Aeromonas hydrophila]MCF7678481.1 CRISPR-associated endonuclease Cas2 [Aeromonas hydrophila]MCF7691529.1 CRISPR-associated endonuclease Cas2 [Aeromonas hydrophila]MCF7772329.1 CRISPR-associated endonuclease Cas2 [Aeromonas hydrophila]
MTTKPLWLIGYDISCPRRLRRMQRRCAEAGWPLQKSLYLLPLTSAERLALCDELKALIEPELDRLLCLPFSVVEGSFHLGPRGPVLLFHDDPRLADYVF